MSEHGRDLVSKYARFEADSAIQRRWDDALPGNSHNLAYRNAAIARRLREDFGPLAGKRVLEIGCAQGLILELMLSLGARSENLYGVDVRTEKIAEAKACYPQMHFSVQEGAQLDFPDASFDLILLINALSSMSSRAGQNAVGREAMRVLRPDGAILWYDMRMMNPVNREITPVPRAQLPRIFPGMKGRLESLTLGPPLARLLGRFFPQSIPFFYRLPFLRSHWLVLLQREK